MRAIGRLPSAGVESVLFNNATEARSAAKDFRERGYKRQTEGQLRPGSFNIYDAKGGFRLIYKPAVGEQG